MRRKCKINILLTLYELAQKRLNSFNNKHSGADQAAIFELNNNFKKSKFKIYGNGGFVNLKINDQKLAIQV